MEPRDYGPYPYVPINDRPVLKWPNGARLAVWIIPNIEFFPLTIGIPGSAYDTRVPAAPTGRKPAGWLGAGLAETWHTLDNLIDEGCLYIADWVSDDQPFWMDLGGGKRIVSIPYSYEINDSPFLHTRNGTIEQFTAAI